MGITEALAKYVMDMRYEDIPDRAVDLAKKAVCDFIGVAIAGKDLEGPRLVKEYVLEHGGNAECSVLGHEFRTSAPLSALLCGTMGHVLDFDDGTATMQFHAGIVIIPVIWTLGEKYNITGKRVIEAFLAGYEAAARIDKFVLGDHSNGLPWHFTKLIGVMSATVTAAKIMELTVAQTRAALGIAATTASGLRQNFGTMTKSLHAGIACHDGIMAARFAKKGFTADMNILEEAFGYRSAYRSGEPMTEEAVIEMMNNKDFWAIADAEDGGIIFKVIAACGASNGTTATAIALAEKENINPDDIESILVEVREGTIKALFYHEPKTGLEGKFSLEYGVAVGLHDRKAGLSQFTDEKVFALTPLMKKVKAKAFGKDEAGRGNGNVITVTMKDGKVFTNANDPNLGRLNNPLPWDKLLEKYRDCVSLYFPAGTVEQSEKILYNIERLDQFRDLVAILAK